MKTNTKTPLSAQMQRSIMDLCVDIDSVRDRIQEVASIAFSDKCDNEECVRDDVIFEMGLMLSSLVASQNRLRLAAKFGDMGSGVKHRARNRTITGIG